MKHKVFTIFDEKAGAYLPPFYLPNAQVAQRVFADCVADPNHNFGRHPGDYSLMQLGSFDDALGRFELHAQGPQTVITGRDMRALQLKSARVFAGDNDDDTVKAGGTD